MVLRGRRFGVRWLDTALHRQATVPVFLTQNGEGTFTRKMIIIASAMMSLASMAPMFPSKLPHPARPASIMRLPAMTSPMIGANHRTNEQANQAEEQSD